MSSLNEDYLLLLLAIRLDVHVLYLVAISKDISSYRLCVEGDNTLSKWRKNWGNHFKAMLVHTNNNNKKPTD